MHCLVHDLLEPQPQGRSHTGLYMQTHANATPNMLLRPVRCIPHTMPCHRVAAASTVCGAAAHCRVAVPTPLAHARRRRSTRAPRSWRRPTRWAAATTAPSRCATTWACRLPSCRGVGPGAMYAGILSAAEHCLRTLVLMRTARLCAAPPLAARMLRQPGQRRPRPPGGCCIPERPRTLQSRGRAAGSHHLRGVWEERGVARTAAQVRPAAHHDR